MTCRGDGRASRTGPGRSLRRDGVTGAFALICVMACTVSHACGPAARRDRSIRGRELAPWRTTGLAAAAGTPRVHQRVADQRDDERPEPGGQSGLPAGAGARHRPYAGLAAPAGPGPGARRGRARAGFVHPVRSRRHRSDSRRPPLRGGAVVERRLHRAQRRDWSTSHLRVGIAGPSALGEQVQNGAHRGVRRRVLVRVGPSAARRAGIPAGASAPAAPGGHGQRRAAGVRT